MTAVLLRANNRALATDAERVSIFGASGYSGLELLRWLTRHPQVRIAGASSDRWAGEEIASRLHGFGGGGTFVAHRELTEAAAAGGVALLATPAETSLELAPLLLERGLRVIDLSGAFRLASADEYPRWYGFHHPKPELLAEAAYGLPELFPLPPSTRLVANPGCYATAAALALAPLVEASLVDERVPLLVDGKSGTTGAGRKAEESFSFSEVADTVRPYRLARHQHTPEIEQVLSRLSGRSITLCFTPQLVPMRRGLIIAGYARAKDGVTPDEIAEALSHRYAGSRFVRSVGLRPAEPGPTVGTNDCEVSASLDPRTGWITVFGALDNLVKGAAGQAIQNLNLLLGLDPATGLSGGSA